MNATQVALTMFAVVLVLIAVYLIPRLASAAWHRSRIEAEAEQAAKRAESQEQDNG